ncbi:MAG: trypsin-like peptidase domain-containing protein, partial [Proteobacteria bacterium]|nr:trypsin-like peptidase domain-containing protein [Pseudomonadota bacterium]
MKKSYLGGAGLTAAVILFAAGLIGAMSPTAALATAAPPSFAPLVEKVSPAVVNIRTVRKVQMPRGFYHFRIIPGRPQGPNSRPGVPEQFRRYFRFGPRPQPQPQPFFRRGQGSGVIIGKDGYILTNYHVVAHSTRIRVQLADRREFPAKVVGSDKRTDLALIKIKAPGNLPMARLGDSSRLKPGDWVIAIGNPLDYD